MSMRNVWSAPGSQTFQGSNQPLFVQTGNTLKTGFFVGQYQLQIQHQQENAVDGGFADSTQFHYLLNSELNDNGAVLTGPIFIFDANDGAAGTANWVLPRRKRMALR